MLAARCHFWLPAFGMMSFVGANNGAAGLKKCGWAIETIASFNHREPFQIKPNPINSAPEQG